MKNISATSGYWQHGLLYWLTVPVTKALQSERYPFILIVNHAADKQRVVATNGKVMTLAEIDGQPFETGTYTVAKRTKSEILLIPDEKERVFPNYASVWQEDTNGDGNVFAGNVFAAYADLMRRLPDQQAINYRFLDVLFCDKTSDETVDTWTVQQQDGSKNIQFENVVGIVRRSAVIAPCLSQ